MKPRRFPNANQVFTLEGGTEDNDLWVEVHPGTIRSVWELTADERQAITDGANISLIVFGDGTPPVAMYVTDEQLGKGLSTVM